MSEIALANVSKLWGETRAVDDVTFTAEGGRLLVLLGPSGCGKSTTLRLIAGLEEVSAGTIRIAGADVTQLPPAQRKIAMVFQSYALFPHLSVAENILFGLKVRGVPRGERDQRLKRVVDLIGLAGLIERKPAQLSGGQRQRVALGRAIIAEQPVCLMDEPLSNLDAQLRHEMRSEIRALQQRLGMTMVYVTHDQVEAMTMADQVILLRGGRIEQDASPDELYARPASPFVARFIGTPPMNLLPLEGTPARVRGGDGPAVIDAAGDGLLLGFRPEDARLDAGHGLPVEIGASEFLGADTIVSCRVGETTVAVRVPGKSRAQPGEPARLAWDAGKLHLFEAESGRRRDDLAAAVIRVS